MEKSKWVKTKWNTKKERKKTRKSHTHTHDACMVDTRYESLFHSVRYLLFNTFFSSWYCWVSVYLNGMCWRQQKCKFEKNLPHNEHYKNNLSTAHIHPLAAHCTITMLLRFFSIFFTSFIWLIFCVLASVVLLHWILSWSKCLCACLRSPLRSIFNYFFSVAIIMNIISNLRTFFAVFRSFVYIFFADLRID